MFNVSPEPGERGETLEPNGLAAAAAPLPVEICCNLWVFALSADLQAMLLRTLAASSPDFLVPPALRRPSPAPPLPAGLGRASLADSLYVSLVHMPFALPGKS
jgi:hypothetical protein